MKNLLVIAACCVFAAATSKAAAVNWQYSGASTDNGKQVIVVLNCTLDANTTYADFMAGKAGEIVGQGSVSKKASNYTANGTAESKNITKTSANLSFVILDTSVAGSEKFWVSSTLDAKSKVFEGAETSPGNATLTDKTTKSYTAFAPVPEPCSVALIALGLAAFGLKRKVA